MATTAKRDIKKLVDDATLKPHEARFFAIPPNRKVLGLNTPFTQSPENTVIDSSHQGANLTYPELYGSCLHGRATTGFNSETSQTLIIKAPIYQETRG